MFVVGSLIRSRRIELLALLSVVAFLALGARCVENTSTRVDSEGYSHVYGEMYNETNIQGYGMLLRARLLAADGSVIAEQDGTLCPPDLAPQQHTVFDIRFGTPNLPAPSSFDVRAIAGQASDVQLPDPKIALLGASATRQQGQAVLRMDIKNNSGMEHVNLNACVAGYDSAGKVIAARSVPLQNFNDQGTPIPSGLGPNPDYALLRIQDPPAGLVTMRGWIWLAADTTNADQAYRAVMTDLVALP
jgi:hypothetical protein